ncbi:MAG: hypothetical protein QOE61_3081 [Micromonosporaceae bacterium]|nr:hypothetical protein [Micromonosporaceae bacterium]
MKKRKGMKEMTGMKNKWSAVALLLGVATGAAVLRQWPEIRRYMKMRQM